MKRIVLLTTAFVICSAAFAQQSPPAPEDKTKDTTAPQLDTADKVALQAIEKAQTDAQTEWNNAEQSKMTILREWALAHQKYHIHYNPGLPQDPKKYTVEANESQDQRPKPQEAPKKPAEAPKK